MTTDGNGSDGNGQGDGSTTTTTYAGPTKDEVQSWVREVMQEMAPAGDDLDRPATLRDVEDRARQITERAMQVLRESPPGGQPPAPTGGDAGGGDEGSGATSAAAGSPTGGGAESSPQNPKDWRDRVRHAIFGDLSA